MWPVEMARPVLTVFAKVTPTAPEELTLWRHLLQFPPLPMVPEPMRGRSLVTIEATYLGSAEEAEQLLAPFRTLPALWADTMDTVQLTELGAICAEPEEPMPAMEYSGLLTRFDEAAVDALVRAAARPARRAGTAPRSRPAGPLSTSAERRGSRSTVPDMASIVLRVRLISGDNTDLTYEDPDIADEDSLVDRVISTLGSDSGYLRCRHGDRLIVLYGRSVATVELSPRGAVL